MLIFSKKHQHNKRFQTCCLNFWIVGLASFLLFSGILFNAYSFSLSQEEAEPSALILSGGNSLSASCSPVNPDLKVVEEIPVVVTAYSSTPSQTDDTPFVTASGSGVKDGVVANNLLPFGTQIRIPEVFGDKVFVVEDRMNWRKGYYMVDVWLPEYNQALAFGAQQTHIEILGR
ncbi:MAG: hypothetical protein GF370_01845 [Candidatus Nealsonbacteria bacterium]|nr:hypothetical protein [Candidatus Nealsonbacteria bacterium]